MNPTLSIHSLLRTVSFSFLFLCSFATYAQWHIDVETGVVPSTFYNEVRIPNADGTLLDLSKDLTLNPQWFYRIRAGYTFNDRHTFSALFAPLQLRSEGNIDRNVQFNDASFSAGTAIRSTYQFNTYRLTYRYEFVRGQKFKLGAGVTGLVRDAFIQLRSDGQSSRFPNLGLVPLIHYKVQWHPTVKWSLLSEADGLAGSKQGRAFDVYGGVGYQLSPHTAIHVGYRFIEGGADVESTYNFAWINFISARLTATF